MVERRLLVFMLWVGVALVTGSEINCSSELIEAEYGEAVTLPCHLQPPQDATDMKVKWSHGPLNHTVHQYQDRRDDPGEQKELFKGRTLLFHDRLTEGNLSLKLSSLRLSDTGKYTCSFHTETLQSSCYIELTVGESDVIGSHIPVKAVVGDHVILPCHLEPPFDVKTLTVEWKRNKTHVHTYRHRKDDPSIQAENFKGRTSLFREEMTRGNISLKLTNVSELDAGNYTCHVPKLHSQVKRGNVTLIVEQVDNGTGNRSNHSGDPGTAAKIGISSGVIVAIIVAIIGAIIGGVVLWGKCKCGERGWRGCHRVDREETRETSQEDSPERVQLNDLQNGS